MSPKFVVPIHRRTSSKLPGNMMKKVKYPPLGLQRAFSNCLFEKLVDGNLIMAGATMPGLTRSVHWIPTKTFDNAFRLSKDILGNNSEIVVVPRVRSTIVNVKKG